MRNPLPLFRQNRLALALMLLATALLARLPYFNESLWYDEVWYTFDRLSGNSLQRVLFHDVHPPLYPVLMKAWIELFGDSEISVRLPSLVFGLASLGLLFGLTLAWFDQRTALLATFLMALSPVHIWHSQEAKNNILLMFLTLLAVYGLQRAWTLNRRRDWLLFVASAILALWTNHFALWVVLAGFLWLWLQAVRNRGHRSLKPVVVSTVVVALGYLPLVWLALRDTGALVREYLRPFSAAEIYKLFLIYLSHGNTLRTLSPYAPLQRILEQHWGFFLIDGFFAFLLGTGLFLAVRHRLRGRTETDRPAAPPDPAAIELLLLYFLVPPLALLAASFMHASIYIERSMIIVLPPFLILLSHGVMGVSRPRWRRAAVSVLLFANILSLASLWVIKRDAWTVYKPNPDWRSFARDLRGDSIGTVVFTSCPPWALQHYLKGSGSIVLWLGSDRDGDKLVVGESVRAVFRKLGMHRPRFFCVAINRYWGNRWASKLNEEVFAREYPLIEKNRYFALDVYKYGFHR